MNNCCFLCGIGGSGMSSLAAALLGAGHRVCGSDRQFDQGRGEFVRHHLEHLGATIFPQDGSGLAEGIDMLVVSSAVEPSIPDVGAALERGIPILKRAELLARLFNQRRGIAVGGTSGKSTVTAMLGHILRETGLSPTVVNGAVMMNSTAADGLGNAWQGHSDWWVIEADESDGSISQYRPRLSVVTTVSEDHLPMERLRELFASFAAIAAEGAIINADCPEAARLSGVHPHTQTFGIESPDATLRAVNLSDGGSGTWFEVEGIRAHVAVPGRHNVLNGLAALAAARQAGVELPAAVAALGSFKGVQRRLQVIGTSPDGITVIDDFAHNPEKIAASLATLGQSAGRLLIFFQPHGFRPTLMMRDGLIAAFRQGLRESDWLLMPDIYYAGGSVSREIASTDLLSAVGSSGHATRHSPDRAETLEWLRATTRPGDRVVIMGARDDTLAEFARQIFSSLCA